MHTGIKKAVDGFSGSQKPAYPERDSTTERNDNVQAIIETGGKQFRVQPGDIIYVEKLEAADGATLTLDKVLAAFDGERTKFGSPYLDGITVECRVIKTGKAKKIRVYKYNAKKNYRRTQGHRQPYTKLQIDRIVV